MKRLVPNYLGKKYLEQCGKLTIKSLFREIEMQLKEELLKVKLDGINIIYTKTNYGGYRKWFECPSCHNKCFTLYKIGKSYKCRKCSGLYYRSQKYSKMLEEKVYKMK